MKIDQSFMCITFGVPLCPSFLCLTQEFLTTLHNPVSVLLDTVDAGCKVSGMRQQDLDSIHVPNSLGVIIM